MPASGPSGSLRSILRYRPLPLVGSWMYITPRTIRMSVGVPMPVRSIESSIAGWSPVRSMAPFASTLCPDTSMVIVNRAVVSACAAVLSWSTKAAGSTVRPLSLESAVAEELGPLGLDAESPGGSATAVESSFPHAASEPSASGTTAAMVARRRVRLRMGPPWLHVVWPHCPAAQRGSGVPDVAVRVTAVARRRCGKRSPNRFAARNQRHDGRAADHVVQTASVRPEDQRRNDQADQDLAQQRRQQRQRPSDCVDPHDPEPGGELAERATRERDQ